MSEETQEKPRNVYEALDSVAARRADAVALSTPGKTDLSFVELRQQIGQTCDHLQRLGVGRGTRVGIFVATRDLMAVAHLAVICLATSAPLNPRTNPDDLELLVTRFKLDTLIIEEGLQNLSDKASELKIELIRLSSDSNRTGDFVLDGDERNAKHNQRLPEPYDVSVLLQTSGTTSKPKIVPRTQSWQLRPLLQEGDEDLKIGVGDRLLNVLPLHHTEGLNFQFLLPVLQGAHVIFSEFEPNKFIELYEQYRPTKITLVPAMYRLVVDALCVSGTVINSFDLRYLESSSAKLPIDLRKQLEDLFNVPVTEGYGATEAGSLAFMGLQQDDLPPGSVGKRAHPGVQIMDESGVQRPPNVGGEIWVKGPTVIAGFEDNKEANEELFRDGWYRTGDTGYIDENEYMFVTGRLREMISRGGELISPYEIDEVLERHPGVSRGAAYGAEDRILGQEVWAAVVADAGQVLNPIEVRAFAAKHLPYEAVPKRIFIVDMLPLTELGKLARSRLPGMLNQLVKPTS